MIGIVQFYSVSFVYIQTDQDVVIYFVIRIFTIIGQYFYKTKSPVLCNISIYYIILITACLQMHRSFMSASLCERSGIPYNTQITVGIICRELHNIIGLIFQSRDLQRKAMIIFRSFRFRISHKICKCKFFSIFTILTVNKKLCSHQIFRLYQICLDP